MPIYQLTDQPVFPSPFLADEDGILAIGGDLSTERLLTAYSHGIFPWFNDDEPIIWHAPDPRFVLFPEKIKISKSMKQLMRQNKFKVTVNQAFESVIKYCAATERKEQDGTWIIPEMIEAYCALHDLGHATSIEVWDHELLVGGLYGVHIGDVFFGESMFQNTSNASKLALIFLAQNLPYKIIDCQVHTSHLESLGAEYISLKQFLTYIN
jgi:leucyl/phenylalanyl-tRNA---protein transferase